MKKIVTASLLCLPFLAAPVRANFLGPINIDSGAGAYCNINIGCGPCCGCKAPASPWYTYWPYQAYFQVPAPLGGYPYPWWTSPKSPPAPVTPGQPSTPVPQSTNLAAPAATVQPASYAPAAPSYWYGR